MVKYLHTMIRVADPEATVAFFRLIGLEEVRRFDSEGGRFTLIFLAAPGQAGVAEVELTYNWPPEDGSPPEDYTGGRNFGHLAYRGTATWPSSNRLTEFRWNCCRKARSNRPNPGRACRIPAAGKLMN